MRATAGRPGPAPGRCGAALGPGREGPDRLYASSCRRRGGRGDKPLRGAASARVGEAGARLAPRSEVRRPPALPRASLRRRPPRGCGARVRGTAGPAAYPCPLPPSPPTAAAEPDRAARGRCGCAAAGVSFLRRPGEESRQRCRQPRRLCERGAAAGARPAEPLPDPPHLGRRRPPPSPPRPLRLLLPPRRGRRKAPRARHLFGFPPRPAARFALAFPGRPQRGTGREAAGAAAAACPLHLVQR